MSLGGYLTGEVVEDYADGLLDRREALRRLGLLGLTLGSAAALLTACGGGGGSDDATGTTATSTRGSPGSTQSTAAETPPPGPPGAAIRFAGASGEVQAAWAAPAGSPKAAVLVVHENRGLTPHFFSLVGRFAAEGYAALCVDLVSAEGGTASITDPAGVPAALQAAPPERLLGDLKAGIDELERRAPGVKVGAVGFCFGGGMAWSLVQDGDSRLAAVAPFYGPAPDPADFSRSKAAVLGVYAGQDDRVNLSRDRAQAALEAADLVHEIRTFEGAGHAFFNDTGGRYDAEAAAEAWAALLAWYDRHLD